MEAKQGTGAAGSRQRTRSRARRDKGKRLITARDRLVLAWIAQQYAARLDQMRALLNRAPGGQSAGRRPLGRPGVGVLRARVPARARLDLSHGAWIAQERADEVNRLQKVLETANVKLAVMAVDVLGKSGREALCFRQTPRLVGRGPSRQQAKQGQAGETAKLPKTSHIRGRSNTRVAWALAHTKDIYLPAFYHRMARRQGKQETITALAHNMLAILYHIL